MNDNTKAAPQGDYVLRSCPNGHGKPVEMHFDYNGLCPECGASMRDVPQGMIIAGDGAAMLGKLMREQRDSRLGVYPDGNPNASVSEAVPQGVASELVRRLEKRLQDEADRRNSAYDRFGMDNTPMSVDPDLCALLQVVAAIAQTEQAAPTDHIEVSLEMVEQAAPQGVASLPTAYEWCNAQTPGWAVSRDWMAGWDAARAALAQTGQVTQGVAWENFPSYLIDHCEGEIITEEGLQHALGRMLRDPQYATQTGQAPAVEGASSQKCRHCDGDGWVPTIISYQYPEGRRECPACSASPATEPAVPAGLSAAQEPKYTVNGHAIVNRASGEEIPADEPVFIIRARDWHAVRTLQYYAAHVRDTQHADAVMDRAEQFRDFRRANPGRMKEPDTAAPKTPKETP